LAELGLAVPRVRLALLAALTVATPVQAGALTPERERSTPVGGDARLAQAISQHQGKPVLVNFWASWCAPCREEMPSLQRLASRWKETGLVVLTVAVADNTQQVEEFLWEALPANDTLPVLQDREQLISRAWGAKMLPTTVILDRRHRIVARGKGAIDWDAPSSDRELKSIIH
jgi:thiol-disulfide isomerase/thioredoxin